MSKRVMCAVRIGSVINLVMREWRLGALGELLHRTEPKAQELQKKKDLNSKSWESLQSDLSISHRVPHFTVPKDHLFIFLIMPVISLVKVSPAFSVGQRISHSLTPIDRTFWEMKPRSRMNNPWLKMAWKTHRTPDKVTRNEQDHAEWLGGK